MVCGKMSYRRGKLRGRGWAENVEFVETGCSQMLCVVGRDVGPRKGAQEHVVKLTRIECAFGVEHDGGLSPAPEVNEMMRGGRYARRQ